MKLHFLHKSREQSRFGLRQIRKKRVPPCVGEYKMQPIKKEYISISRKLQAP